MDFEIFPLLGNILVNRYPYGRIPASSFPMENEFKKLESDFVRNIQQTIRVDAFLGKYLNYFQGNVLLVHAVLDKEIKSSESVLEDLNEAQN